MRNIYSVVSIINNKYIKADLKKSVNAGRLKNALFSFLLLWIKLMFSAMSLHRAVAVVVSWTLRLCFRI